MTQTLDGIFNGSPNRLTDEVIKQLSAPVPANEIQTKRQGGADIRFTSDKFVEHRLDNVVGSGGWEDNYESVSYARPIIKKVGKGDREREVQFLGVTTCHLTVLGVTKSGQADLEFEDSMYGTPATNAQARAFKRAAKKFGIARELWDKDVPAADDDEEAPRKSGGYERKQSSTSQRQPSGGGSKGPSEGQATWLTKAVEKGGFGVPGKIVKGLTGGRAGTASLMIEALKEAKADSEDYEDDVLGYIREALWSYKVKDDQGNILRVGIDRELAKQLPDSDADDDEDEDL